jgi:Peptidase family S41
MRVALTCPHVLRNMAAVGLQVFAGALQDNRRAVVIGERTFGKGVVQFFFRMDDGSGIKLTVAKYLTPKMHDVALDGGIDPDLICRCVSRVSFTRHLRSRHVVSGHLVSSTKCPASVHVVAAPLLWLTYTRSLCSEILHTCQAGHMIRVCARDSAS